MLTSLYLSFDLRFFHRLEEYLELSEYPPLLHNKKASYHLQKTGKKFLVHFGKVRNLEYSPQPLHVGLDYSNLLSIGEIGKEIKGPLCPLSSPSP